MLNVSKQTLQCPCGATVVYDNPMTGAMNVGHFLTATGWYSWHNNFTFGSVLVCPECRAKVNALAKEIVDIVKTPYISLNSILQ